MKAMSSWLSMLCLTATLSAPVAASAADAVLYELTEAVKIDDGARFKSSQATLAGRIRAGTSLCPTWLAAQLKSEDCAITVRAVGKADDATGIGPVTGELQIVVQDRNAVDSPEIVVLKGKLNGTLDLSSAFVKQVPVGTIRGKFNASGVPGSVAGSHKANGAFTGVFRIPFEHGGRPAYLLDNGTIEYVRASERALGIPTVRLEITLE